MSKGRRNPKDLRGTFWEVMSNLAGKDDKVIVLTGDLGYSFYEGFAEKFPDRFINCGCIEQSMVGIAAGLALAGWKPYVYSGSVFLLTRAYEQIRDDVAYNRLNVKLVGTGASGFLGFTHNFENNENEEDLLKNLPLRRFFPVRPKDLEIALRYSKGAFIRL